MEKKALEKKLRVTDIKVPSRHRKDKGDLDALAASIREIGLLHPPVVNQDHVLLAGERRLLAVQKLGWTEVPVRVIDLDDLLKAEWDENECRKDFSPFEKLAVADAIKERIGDRRGERTGRHANGSAEHVGETPQVKPGEKTRDVAARCAGFTSTDEYRSVKKVKEKGVQELQAALDGGIIPPTSAAEVADLNQTQQRAVVHRVQEGKKVQKAIDMVAGRSRARKKTKGRARLAKPTKSSKADPVEVDSLGNVVPENLRDVFADRMLRDQLDMMRIAVPQIKSASFWNPFLELGHATDGLQNAITALADAIPYAVHDKCDGKGCDDCRGKGWLPKWRYEEVKFQDGGEG
jgi:ParB/RepB/Spo0J family partition protein